MTPLKRPKFIRISINDIPEEIIIEYKLRVITDSKGCTSKPTVECTGSHNQDFWRMNYWKNDSTKEAITKANWYQDSGATNGAQSSSHWSSTTSG